MDSNGRSVTGRAAAILASIYIAERALLVLLGIRFNTEALDWYWQVLDIELLRDRLLESLTFLHAQPPLFNLMLGCCLKAGPSTGPEILHGLYLALGLVLAMTLLGGLVELGWPERTAILAVSAVALTPGWIVYENWLFYDFPVVVLLAVAVVALLRFARTDSGVDFGVFFGAVVLVALTRSLFHLVWLAGCSACLLPAVRRRRPRIVVLFLPLFVVGSVYMKNTVLFGFFGPSSWLGMSLDKMVTARIEPGQRRNLVAAGELSPFAVVPPFSPLERYEEASGVRFPDSPIPALGRRTKENGQPNFNHLGFVEISARCRRDALVAVRRFPGVYMRSVVTAVRRFFSSGVAYPPFLENLLIVAPLYRLGEALWSRPIVIVIAFFGSWLISFRRILRAFQCGRPRDAVPWLFVCWTMAWVFFVGNLVEIGENHRFRFELISLIWIGLASMYRFIGYGGPAASPVGNERDGEKF